MEMESNKETIQNVQTLRAVAALAVVFLHTTSQAGLGLWPSFGNFGVDIFFVISGFIISYMTSKDPSSFMVKRVVRIVPFYWSATLALFALGSVAPQLLRSTEVSPSLLLHSLAFIPYAHGQNNTEPLLALGWTLNYEMYFYVVFWLAMKVSYRHRSLICCAAMLAVMAMIRVSGTNSPVLLFFADPIIFEFMLGVLGFRAYAAVRDAQGPSSRGGAYGLLALVAASFVALPILEMRAVAADPEIYWRALYLGVPAFLIVSGAVLLERVYKVRVTGWLWRQMGDASYILYLIHPYLVYGVIRVALSRLSPMGMAIEWLMVVLLLAMSVAIAIAIHRWFERPILNLLRSRLFLRPRLVA
jgi:exopolysaccharide production protein ExoZ